MRFSLDRYTLRARVAPPLIVALPLALFVLALDPNGAPRWGALWGIVAWCGGTFLLAQVGRDWGRRKQPALFQRWGGTPSTRGLRHRGAANPVLVCRYHQRLSELLPELTFPSPAEETRDPTAADRIYEAAVAALLERTRDDRLVFEENCNYGFRRNLWAMKPLGLAVAAFFLGGSCGLLAAHLYFGAPFVASTAVAATGVNLLLFLAWLLVITEDWVRQPAEAYATRLLAACERI